MYCVYSFTSPSSFPTPISHPFGMSRGGKQLCSRASGPSGLSQQQCDLLISIVYDVWKQCQQRAHVVAECARDAFVTLKVHAVPGKHSHKQSSLCNSARRGWHKALVSRKDY